MEEIHFKQSTFQVDVLRVVTRVINSLKLEYSPKRIVTANHISIGDSPSTYISLVICDSETAKVLACRWNKKQLKTKDSCFQLYGGKEKPFKIN